MPLTDYPKVCAPGISEGDVGHISRIINILEDLHGKITSPHLEGLLGIKGPKLRALVNYARRADIPICSGGDGYWMAKEPDDLDTTIAHVGERIRSMEDVQAGLFRAKANMRKMTFREDLFQ